LIEKALSEAARKALDMDPQIKQFFSEAHQRSYAKGKAEGEAKGEAKAVMMILQQRGLVPTDEQQRQILSCTDVAILDRWLTHVLSVASVDELLA
jgi:flagellar biosynthesis/type III secretory pathway protein FliH